MLDHSHFVLTVAGIALFMHGMQLASENLQKLTANRTRDLMAKLSHNKFLGVVLGVVMTVMIQSSGAVTSMLVGLGSAKVINLRQVMTVLLGIAIGTTFTVQLISFKLTHWGLPIFAAAFFVYFLTKQRTLQKLMGVFMGFGLIFFGIEIIGQGTIALKSIDNFVGFLETLNQNPLYTVAATALFTAVVHSSAVTIGFAMSLAAAQLISFENSIFWVFGANIGTTGTALLASMGGNYIGRQVAWAHCFHKLLSVLLFIPMVPWLVEIFGPMSVERGIANFHTFYNLVAAVVFYPGVGWGATLVERLFPPTKSEQDYGPRYLVRSDWLTVGMAIAHAERESLRMADIVGKMLKDSLELFKNEDPVLAKEVKARDDKVDILTRAIRLYLTQGLNWSENRSPQDQKDVMRILNFTADLENAADVIDNNLREMAAKKHNLKLEFSPQGWSELVEFHAKVMEVFSYSINCFVKRDENLASQVIFCKREIRKIEQQFRETHLTRLIKGEQNSINTSSIHMDVLSEYRRISGLLSNHVYETFYHTDKYNILPRQMDTQKPTDNT